MAKIAIDKRWVLLLPAVIVAFLALRKINDRLLAAEPVSNSHVSADQSGGLGICLLAEDTGFKIDRVLEGSSPELKQIEKGSILEAIDGQPVRGLPGDQVVRMLRGPVSSSATLSIATHETTQDIHAQRSSLDSLGADAKRALSERVRSLSVMADDDPRFLDAANALSEEFEKSGCFRAAAHIRQRAVASLRRTCGSASPQTAIELGKLAKDFSETSDKKALLETGNALIESSRSYQTRLPDAISLSMSTAGLEMAKHGLFDKAKPLFDIACAQVEHSPQQSRRTQVTQDLALAQEAAGDRKSAIKNFRQVIEWYDKSDSPDTDRVARNHLIDSLCTTGEPGLAERLIVEDWNKRRLPFADPQDHTRRLLNEASVCALQNKFDIAQYSCHCAVSFWNEFFWLNPRHKQIQAERMTGPTIADALCLGAQMDAHNGSTADARNALDRALSIRKTALGSTNPLTAAVESEMDALANGSLKSQPFPRPVPLFGDSAESMVSDVVPPEKMFEEIELSYKKDAQPQNASAAADSPVRLFEAAFKASSMESKTGDDWVYEPLARKLIKENAKDNSQQLAYLEYLGRFLFCHERFDESMDSFTKARKILDEEKQPLSAEQQLTKTRLLEECATVCRKINDTAGEVALRTELLEMQTTAPSANGETYLSSLVALAGAEVRNGNVDSACAHAAKLIEATETWTANKTEKPSTQFLLSAASALCDNHHPSTKLEGSLRTICQKLDALETPKESKLRYQAYKFLAQELVLEHRYDGLIELFDSVHSRRLEETPPMWTDLVYEIDKRGDHEQSIRVGKHVLEAYDAAHQQSATEAVRLARALTQKYVWMSDFDSAYPLAQRVYSAYVTDSKTELASAFFADEYLPILTKLNKRLEAQACVPR